MEQVKTTYSYEEVCQLIGQVGIVPLSGLIPDHPSLEGITLKEDWHSGSEQDPWLWRVRFPGEGIAAYGKLLKKKAIFISKDLFPYIQMILTEGKSMQEAFETGLISRTAFALYLLIEQEQGINTRSLRSEAGLKDKSDKKRFDDAVVELQERGYIVISGVSVKLNEQGEQSGWNSTSYETSEHWMGEKALSDRVSLTDAKKHIAAYWDKALQPAARAFMFKAWKV